MYMISIQPLSQAIYRERHSLRWLYLGRLPNSWDSRSSLKKVLERGAWAGFGGYTKVSQPINNFIPFCTRHKITWKPASVSWERPAHSKVCKFEQLFAIAIKLWSVRLLQLDIQMYRIFVHLSDNSINPSS